MPGMRTQTETLPFPALTPVSEPGKIHGLPFAHGLEFSQIIVTGPPGSGKSTFIARLGGWPEEGYLDLTRAGWWHTRALALRPCEVHLGIPFRGHPQALSLFDEAWSQHWDELQLESSRIRFPPRKRFPLMTDWRHRFAFEFLLPTATTIAAYRHERAKLGTHPIDAQIDPAQIRAQIRVCAEIAQLFHQHGMTVHIRQQAHDIPAQIADSPDATPWR